MPNVTYSFSPSARVDHLTVLEKFLDDNREEISLTLHNDLLDVFTEMNEAAGDAWSSMESEMESMDSRIKELEAELNDNE